MTPKRTPTKPRATKRRASEGLAYIDGRVVELRDAKVPLMDRGFLLGDGVFETLRVSNGVPFRLADHATRIGHGLQAIGLSDDLESEFLTAVDALVKAGHKAVGDELYLRVMVSTGPMEDLLGTGRGLTVCGLVRRFKPYPLQYYANGVHLVQSRQRKSTQDPLCGVKTLSFLPYLSARRDAHAATAHDAVLLNEHGRIAEASTSNVFALRGDVIHAPGLDEGAIAGVTRQAVLELIADAGLDVVERLEVKQLASANEAFLTNTTGGVVPVTRFCDKPIGKGKQAGKKGELATRLGHALEDAIRGAA